jgi:hypothetical protein
MPHPLFLVAVCRLQGPSLSPPPPPHPRKTKQNNKNGTPAPHLEPRRQAAPHRLRLATVHDAGEGVHRLAVYQDVQPLQVRLPAGRVHTDRR